MLAKLLQLCFQVCAWVIFHGFMLSMATLIWVSFDYGAYYSCETQQRCFASYVDYRVGQLDNVFQPDE